MGTVKTWRVTTAKPLKVGDSLRYRGDFVPEAKDWPALRAHLSAEFIEEVWVDEEVLEKGLRDIQERERAEREANKPKKKKVRGKKRIVKKVNSNGKRGELTEQSV